MDIYFETNRVQRVDFLFMHRNGVHLFLNIYSTLHSLSRYQMSTYNYISPNLKVKKTFYKAHSVQRFNVVFKVVTL